MKITIFINDIQIKVSSSSTLLQATQQFGAKPPFALVLNQDFIPGSEHQHIVLQQNDRVEIISAIQGG